jgi:SulP family sulfate permease
MAMAFTVVIMAGFFQIAFGLMRLGKYVTLMPYPVVSGFMSGIGVILIILQIGPVLGQANPDGGVIGILQNITSIFGGIDFNEVTLAIITIGILYLTPGKFKQYVPPQLLALILVTILSVTVLTAEDTRRIGEIPTGLPAIQMPVFSMDEWRIMLVDALVLGMLGCIDALLTSVIADSLTRTQHNSDKELIGQGIGNTVSGLFGGLPGAGATMGTVVGIQAGARTALSGLVRASILIVVVLWAADLTATIPLAVLAAIALKVGIDIIDWKFIRRAHRISLKGALIAYSVIALTVFVDLIVAVGIGLFIANIITVTRLSEMQEDDVKVVNTVDDLDKFELSPKEEELIRSAEGRILFLHLNGAMIFGTSRVISRKYSEIEECNTLIIDLTDVYHLGVSSALALEESILDMTKASRCVYIIGAKGQVKERLQNLGILSAIPENNLLDSRLEAMERALAC